MFNPFRRKPSTVAVKTEPSKPAPPAIIPRPVYGTDEWYMQEYGKTRDEYYVFQHGMTYDEAEAQKQEHSAKWNNEKEERDRKFLLHYDVSSMDEWWELGHTERTRRLDAYHAKQQEEMEKILAPYRRVAQTPIQSPIRGAASVRYRQAPVTQQVHVTVETKPKKEKHKRGHISDGMRFRVMRRDKFRCQICGKSAADGMEMQIDHKVPVIKGGLTTYDNLQLLCEPCNRGKSDHDLHLPSD